MTQPTDDRLDILLAQLDGAWELLDARLTGRHHFHPRTGSEQLNMTDDEYFWEPAPNCWSLRPRGEARSANPSGTGEWLLDHEYPEPNPPPFTTIAWRMCHVCVSPLFRYDYTFGSRALTLDDIVWPSTAHAAFDFVREAHMRWRDALAGLTTEQLDTVGLSTNPMGLDPNVRFVDLVAWTNIELTHHAAEIGCLRDLYRAIH